MVEFNCVNCLAPFPESGVPYRCLICGGVYDFNQLDVSGISLSDSGGSIWKYKDSFGLPPDVNPSTLGEGGTPLIESEFFGRKVYFKFEGLNPTGSYKDRGSSVLVSLLKSRHIEYAVEDSSGNAGASFAAYAGSSGIKTKIFVPETASGPKLRQIEVYGAEIKQVPGARSNAAEAVKEEADRGIVYASHAYLPHGLTGYATIAYELFEQLGESPGAVISPVGQGNLILAIGRGFQALKNSGIITSIPKLIGVQARACAPLWAVFQYGSAGLGWVSEGETIAEGVKVKHPIRGDQVLRIIDESLGNILAVDEEDILPGRDQLAKRGLYVEPTSALVMPALKQSIELLPDPVVVILTGIGLKSSI